MNQSKKTRLELTWIGKENRPRLEPRVILEDPGKSYHAKHRVTDHDIFDNLLISGDNLVSPKALDAERSCERRERFDAENAIARQCGEPIGTIERQRRRRKTAIGAFVPLWPFV